MMTARLLLMPVRRSVELNVVLWARAGTVLSASMAAAMRSEGSRAWILGRIYLINFIRVVFLIFLSSFSGFFAESRDHNLTSARSCGVCHTHPERRTSGVGISGFKARALRKQSLSAFKGVGFVLSMVDRSAARRTLTTQTLHPTDSRPSAMLYTTNVWVEILNQFAVCRTGLMKPGNVFLESASQW